MLTKIKRSQTLLTVPEVAGRLRLSVWTVYRLVEAEKLPAIRIGAGPRAPIRIDESELEAWLSAEPGVTRTAASGGPERSADAASEVDA